MFSLVIIFAFLICAGICFYKETRSTDTIVRDNWATAGIILCVFATIWFVSAVAGPSVSALQTVNNIQVTQKNIGVAEHRRDQYTDTIHSILDQYPKYENSTFSNIHPEIILSYPELKTNDVLKEEVSKILDANEQVFKLQQRLNAQQQAVKAVHNNPFAITFVWWPSS